MSRLRRSVRHLLDIPVEKIELSAAPPFVKIVFTKGEMQTLLQNDLLIAKTVAKYFNRRRVFWMDIRKENANAVVKSLKEVESELNEWPPTPLGNNMAGLERSVIAWATATSLVRRELGDRLHEIARDKASIPGYDSANEDRFAAMHSALVSLRQQIYPLVGALVDFLEDDNDPTKTEAQRILHTKTEAQCILDQGLNLIPDAALIRGCIPEVNEATSG